MVVVRLWLRFDVGCLLLLDCRLGLKERNVGRDRGGAGEVAIFRVAVCWKDFGMFLLS